MPYIVTAKREDQVIAREAMETLDDVRWFIADGAGLLGTTPQEAMNLTDAGLRLTENGGSILLADIVIDVEPVKTP